MCQREAHVKIAVSC